jgi:hypothetical protein
MLDIEALRKFEPRAQSTCLCNDALVFIHAGGLVRGAEALLLHAHAPSTQDVPQIALAMHALSK